MTPSSTRSTQPKRMTSAEYREVYLRSDHWRQTRLHALERAEHRCQVCNRDGQLDVHHRTYERLGEERPADLTALCRGCHNLFHKKGKKLAPTKHARNWSTLPEVERTDVEMRCLRSLVTDGPAKTRTIAANIDERTQVVGSCFVALRRAQLVRKSPKTSLWSPTAKGISASGVKPKAKVDVVLGKPVGGAACTSVNAAVISDRKKAMLSMEERNRIRRAERRAAREAAEAM